MSIYNLEDRTLRFSEDLIKLCQTATKNSISAPIINQLIRSGTSVGANYCEANAASSKKDFKNKIHICKKESQETSYWLHLLIKIENSAEAKKLKDESNQLTLIFGKIISTINKSNQN